MCLRLHHFDFKGITRNKGTNVPKGEIMAKIEIICGCCEKTRYIKYVDGAIRKRSRQGLCGNCNAGLTVDGLRFRDIFNLDNDRIPRDFDRVGSEPHRRKEKRNLWTR